MAKKPAPTVKPTEKKPAQKPVETPKKKSTI